MCLWFIDPPPDSKTIYHGDKLERSFDDIVLSNIIKVIGKFQAPTPDIILAGDFNFPKAQWDAGIGTVQIFHVIENLYRN